MLLKNTAARGLIPVAPIRRLIEQWSANEVDVRALLGPTVGNVLGNSGKIAYLTGLSCEAVKSIRFRGREWIEFDVADRIICRLYGPLYWHVDEELAAIYEDFDLAALDEKLPTTRAAA